MCLVKVNTYRVGKIGLSGTSTYTFEVEPTWYRSSWQCYLTDDGTQSFYELSDGTSVIVRVVHYSNGRIKCVDKFILTVDATKMYRMIKDQS